MTHFKSIKLKALHHPEYHLTTRLRLRNRTEDFNAEKACLFKYFPKYYRNLIIEIPEKDWASVKKLQQTKAIDHLTRGIDGYGFRTNSAKKNFAKKICELEQRIFKNKRKSVKSLPLLFSLSGRKGSSHQDLRLRRPQLSTFFPRLTSLNLTQIDKLGWGRYESPYVDRKCQQKIWRSYACFWKGFRCLKHLEMSSDNYYFWFMIREVNSSSHFLSSLKTFKLSLVFSADPLLYSNTRDLLHQLTRNGHLLNHVTHLDCKKFEILYKFDEIMGSILAQCSRLVFLNILIGREAHYFADLKDLYPEHEGTQVFHQLSKMSRLETLNVSAFGTESFVKHFSIPPSVQKLILYVGKSLKDQSWLDLFLEPEYNFFERLKGLSNLHALKLKIRVIDNLNDLLHKFLSPLLKALDGSGLKKLRFEVTEAASYTGIEESGVLDFSLLPQESALKQLESFKIISGKIGITIDLKNCQFLLGLKKFATDGPLTEEFDLKSFLQSFSSFPSKDRPQRSLKLPRVSFQSIETFDEFLKFAKKEVRSGNLVLNLKLALFVEKDLKELFNHYKYPINLGESCNVDLKIWLMPPVGWDAEKKELSEKDKNAFERIFGSFKFTVIQRGSSYHGNQMLLEF